MATFDRATRFNQRPTPLLFVRAVSYIPGRYQPTDGLPVIELVAASGPTPAHGVYHGPGGDIVVNIGDKVSVTPTGDVGITTWYDFESNYEENA